MGVDKGIYNKEEDAKMAVWRSRGESKVFIIVWNHTLAMYGWSKKKVTITSSIASSQRMGYQVSSYK